MATRALQVMVPDELLALLDNHVARIAALHPSMSVTRSGVAREWLEQAFSMMEHRLRAQEDVATVAMQQPLPATAPEPRPFTGRPTYVPAIPPLKRGRPKR